MKRLSNHAIFLPHLKTASFGSLPPTATQNVSSTNPLLTFLALAFTVLNLLLLCNLNSTSSMLLSWLSFSYQTGMQVFYITPPLNFSFIVVSSVFQLFSTLDRFSPIPTTPIKFHHHLQAWIHSTLVTPDSRLLSPCFGRATHHWFHQKYPLKFHQIDCWMTCHPPQLPQLAPSFFTLLLMAWTCWMHNLNSWFTWLLFQEGENRHQIAAKF